jgi:hypothetical protein
VESAADLLNDALSLAGDAMALVKRAKQIVGV